MLLDASVVFDAVAVVDHGVVRHDDCHACFLYDAMVCSAFSSSFSAAKTPLFKFISAWSLPPPS